MWCILGLGNPEPRYRHTRHNLGFMVVEELAERNKASWHRHRHHLEARVGQRLILAKPQTYMNLSGQAAAWLHRYRRIPVDRMLVVCDDLALPQGSLRLRATGSDGGHKGLRSIIESLGRSDFPRLRLGIGPLPQGWDAADFVLAVPSPSERTAIAPLVAEACQAVDTIVSLGLEKAMNQINRKTKKEPR